MDQFGWNQQFEHEQLVCLLKIVGELFESSVLTQVEGRIPFRIRAHEHFREGRMECFDVLSKVLILELELHLSTLLSRYSSDKSLTCGVAQDSGTEFLVNENASVILWHLVGDGLLKTFIDDVFAIRNGNHLFHIERLFPTKES